MITAIQGYKSTPKLQSNKSKMDNSASFGSTCEFVPVGKAVEKIRKLANSNEARTAGFLSGFKNSIDVANKFIANDGRSIKCTFEFSDIEMESNMRPRITVCGKFRTRDDSLNIESEKEKLTFTPFVNLYCDPALIATRIEQQIQQLEDFKSGNSLLSAKK